MVSVEKTCIRKRKMIMAPNAETSLDRRVLSRVKKKGPFSRVTELKYIILKVQIRLKTAKNKKTVPIRDIPYVISGLDLIKVLLWKT